MEEEGKGWCGGEGDVEVRETAGDANSIFNICLCSADFRVHAHTQDISQYTKYQEADRTNRPAVPPSICLVMCYLCECVFEYVCVCAPMRQRERERESASSTNICQRRHKKQKHLSQILFFMTAVIRVASLILTYYD